MGYSRAVRRQLIVLDLIEGVLDGLEKESTLSDAEQQAAERVRSLQRSMRAQLVLVNREGGVVFESDKEFRRYRRDLHAVENAIMRHWPGEELDGREYCNMVLVFLDRFLQHPHKMKEWWLEMSGALQGLYEQMDPSLTAEEQMDAGEQAASALQDALQDI